jgi:uncharacterized protein (DUF1697 family)
MLVLFGSSLSGLGNNIMTPVHYLALLRGINVGGSNIIKMADLKACFQNMGCTDVTTYIQSGNVIFRSEEQDTARLVRTIERELSTRFAYSSRVVVLTREQLAYIVEHAPDGFGAEPDIYRYDVIFLKEPLTAAEALGSVNPKPGVDTAHEGQGALYFSRLISKATQSRLSRIIGLPIYQNMTIRNWNTTTKLLALMDKAGT